MTRSFLEAVWPMRFYRAVPSADTNVLTGDILVTNGGDVVIHPINHATFVMSWNGKTIYNDPVGGSSPFRGLPRADLIQISHAHTDHFDSSTLTAVKGTGTILVVPPTVYQTLPTSLRPSAIVLTNGAR